MILNCKYFFLFDTNVCELIIFNCLYLIFYLIFRAANVFDGLRNFFSENIVNSVTYFVSLIDNIVQMSHHVAILHEDTLGRLYEISKKHQNLVQKMLINLQPTVYKRIIHSFSRLDLVEVCNIYYMFQDYYFSFS